jgi:hypothetical protein
MTMPSPDGCFVHVWDALRFAGTPDFINGPRDYATLRDLPGGRLWNDRIRSATTGPVATVTFWTDENFQGRRMTLAPDTEYGWLPEAIVGQTESMNITCPAAPAITSSLF